LSIKQSNRQFDVVVIGGGIHGAGAAQAAAAAGHSVLVLEQTALAAGTSSRSSKLIHGGLRYLESAQFNLVRECLHERTLLLQNAPDLVKLKPFYIPIYPGTSRRPWQIRSGLALYSALGGWSDDARFRIVPKQEWQKLDGLELRELEKVFCYFDAQTDDAALTRAVMRSAQSLGAELAMPAEFVSALRSPSKDDRYIIKYRHNGQELICEASLIINAAGPWANQVLSRVSPTVKKLNMDLVQGTHIILEGQVTQGIYYVEAPDDGRAVFVMPWQNRVMVGTTESIYHGDPAKVAPLASEVEYLCQTLEHYFPVYRRISTKDVVGSFAGLRVLPKSNGSAFSRPRDTIFHSDNHDKPRLVTLYGGKLTAYRATSERLLHQYKDVLPKRKPVADTRTLPLTPES